MAVTLLKGHNREIEAIWDEIEEAEGVISEEQEKRLAELMADELGLIDQAREIKNREAAVNQLKTWVREAQDRARTWEKMIEDGRNRLRTGMETIGVRKLKSEDGFLTLSMRRNTVGRLELADPALDKETSVRGYTSEQVENSTIPLSYWKATTVYVLEKDMVKAHLIEGHKVGLAGVNFDDSMQIRTAKVS